MKLAANRYSVVVKGTKRTPFYYGFTTRDEAEEMKSRVEGATGVEHEVIDNEPEGGEVKFNQHIIVAYKFDNGYMRECKILEYSNNRERLEYLIDCTNRYDGYKKGGYRLAVYSLEQEQRFGE